MTFTEIENQGLLRALSATVMAFENLVTLTDRVCLRLRHEHRADDPELQHVEEQLRAARERVPAGRAYLHGLSAEPRIY